jgi:hypothetical protein
VEEWRERKQARVLLLTYKISLRMHGQKLPASTYIGISGVIDLSPLSPFSPAGLTVPAQSWHSS